ncbi:MAG: hypothetical protein KAI79_04420 [Bacteroidales bacterium]|nr:hypothetical protein [Bacteroidales bacterium]
MIGVFSPSVSVIETNVQSSNSSYSSISPIQLNLSLFNTAEAKRGGRGGARRGGGTRRNKSRSGSRNRNVNVNRNVNKNVNVNVNRNNRYYGGSRRGGYGYYRGRHLVGFGVGLAMGSVIAASTMPSSCVTTYVNGISYRRCGSAYYHPQYEGSTVVYQVVSSPY